MAYSSGIVRGRYPQNAGATHTAPALLTRLLTAFALCQNNSHFLVRRRNQRPPQQTVILLAPISYRNNMKACTKEELRLLTLE